MASSDVSGVSSHFSYAAEGFITTTSGSVASGAATIPLTSVSGLTTGNVFVGIIEPGLTKQQVFTGTVDVPGVQITGVVYTRGSNATHSAGVTIVDYVTGTGHNMLTKGMLVSHKQAGTMIDSLPLTTPKITTSINDSGGNEVIKTPATASAVNEVTVTNAATGSAPSISATGNDAAINLNLRGKGLGKTVNIGAGAVNIFAYDYVASGCVWTADNAGVNKNASMTAGVVVINGNPVTVAAVTARVFSASKDVYVDVLDNGDGTGLLVYTDGTTNAASGALAANSIRLAIVVVGAGSIAAASSINQGQIDRVLPIASSIPYTKTDSLGNLICPRDPNRKVIGYRQVITNLTSTTTASDMTGLNLTCIIPTGRDVLVSGFIGQGSTSVVNNAVVMTLVDVTAGASIATAGNATNASGDSVSANPFATSSLGGTRNFKAQLGRGANAATANSNGAATNPNYIMVELK